MSFELDIKTAEDIAAEALAGAKATAMARLAAILDAQAAALTDGVPLAEQMSWAVKGAVAAAYMAGTHTAEDEAMLAAEAAETGETLDELAQRILDRVASHKAAAGKVAGVRRKVQAAIAAAGTVAEVEAIVSALDE